MGLVQSQSDGEQETFEVDGFHFSVESSLRKFATMYGNFVVDFRQSFFGEGFMISFTDQSSC